MARVTTAAEQRIAELFMELCDLVPTIEMEADGDLLEQKFGKTRLYGCGLYQELVELTAEVNHA